MPHRLLKLGFVSLLFLSGLFLGLPTAHSQDAVMGQIQFVQPNDAAKTLGVWVDGQYVGYVGELQGRNRLRLLPGQHEVVIRQAGFEDFNRKVMIEPGKILDVKVGMERDTRFQYPNAKTSAQVRLDVSPYRAAVFLDDVFVGHVDEFYGLGHGMLLVPGKHKIKIGLGGYKTFETEVTLLPRQKFTLKTNLVEGSINDADPLIKGDRTSSLHVNSVENEAVEQTK